MPSTASYCALHAEDRRSAARERDRARRDRAEQLAAARRRRVGELVEAMIAGLDAVPGPAVPVELLARIAGKVAVNSQTPADTIARWLDADAGMVRRVFAALALAPTARTHRAPDTPPAPGPDAAADESRAVHFEVWWEPAAHDRLLQALRAQHPKPPADVAVIEGPLRRLIADDFRRSPMGCSSGNVEAAA